MRPSLIEQTLAVLESLPRDGQYQPVLDLIRLLKNDQEHCAYCDLLLDKQCKAMNYLELDEIAHRITEHVRDAHKGDK